MVQRSRSGTTAPVRLYLGWVPGCLCPPRRFGTHARAGGATAAVPAARHGSHRIHRTSNIQAPQQRPRLTPSHIARHARCRSHVAGARVSAVPARARVPGCPRPLRSTQGSRLSRPLLMSSPRPPPLSRWSSTNRVQYLHLSRNLTRVCTPPVARQSFSADQRDQLYIKFLSHRTLHWHRPSTFAACRVCCLACPRLLGPPRLLGQRSAPARSDRASGRCCCHAFSSISEFVRCFDFVLYVRCLTTHLVQ